MYYPPPPGAGCNQSSYVPMQRQRDTNNSEDNGGKRRRAARVNVPEHERAGLYRALKEAGFLNENDVNNVTEKMNSIMTRLGDPRTQYLLKKEKLDKKTVGQRISPSKFDNIIEGLISDDPNDIEGVEEFLPRVHTNNIDEFARVMLAINTPSQQNVGHGRS